MSWLIICSGWVISFWLMLLTSDAADYQYHRWRTELNPARRRREAILSYVTNIGFALTVIAHVAVWSYAAWVLNGR